MNKKDIEQFTNKECKMYFDGMLSGKRIMEDVIIHRVIGKYTEYILKDNDDNLRFLPNKNIVSLEEI